MRWYRIRVELWVCDVTRETGVKIGMGVER